MDVGGEGGGAVGWTGALVGAGGGVGGTAVGGAEHAASAKTMASTTSFFTFPPIGNCSRDGDLHAETSERLRLAKNGRAKTDC